MVSLWTMGDCKCCNDLGSSPKFQLFITIAITVLFVLLGVYSYSVIDELNHFGCPPSWSTDKWSTYETLGECYTGRYRAWSTSRSHSAAFYAGFFVSILCMITFISRCCAPCCCQLSDVPSPCPCTSFGLLDLCFFVGCVVATWPLNVNIILWTEDRPREERTNAHLSLWLGMLMLLVAVPLGCLKFKRY